MSPSVIGSTAMKSTPHEPLILAERLTRIYPLGESSVVGLQDVSLRIHDGAFILLKGASGSGKSTLLSLLAGLDRPTSGRILVDGRDLGSAGADEMTRYRRETVGIVFQSFNLMPTLNVMENICLPGLLAGRPASAVKARARELLEWLQMVHRQRHIPAQLSGGEMQRVAIARALINDPRIIFADEPTGNLDSRNGRLVVEMLREMNQTLRRTLVLATHSPMADSLATAIITLRDGTVVDTAWKS
ncbi:MAG: ABC transporter ATP-binding protein [Syntrophobacteraceae bacterium]|nr:ABC transporter ATP-binding protein [Syntrophobacteraceae bacterium]